MVIEVIRSLEEMLKEVKVNVLETDYRDLRDGSIRLRRIQSG